MEQIFFHATMTPDSTHISPDALLEAYSGKVRVRVGGLLLRDGALLLAAHTGLLPQAAPFWSPPGGGWQFGESIRAALVREFREETGLTVRVGRFLHLHEFSSGPLQALELFFEVLATEADQPELGHDPEHLPHQQVLTGLAWQTPRQLLQLPPAQVHPVLRMVLSLDDVFVPQINFVG
ncbi:MAG: hypothetical protein NVSMB30_02530 [Hymenobacter sp.]